jgi:hypothetical protein
VERRRDERFDTDLPISLEQGGSGILRNVSASGVYFLTDVDLKPGERIVFTVQFTALPIGTIVARCAALVRWVEPRGALRGVGAELEHVEFHRQEPLPAQPGGA